MDTDEAKNGLLWIWPVEVMFEDSRCCFSLEHARQRLRGLPLSLARRHIEKRRPECGVFMLVEMNEWIWICPDISFPRRVVRTLK